MQALWMVAAAFLFATMGVFVKYASASFTTAEVVFYRGIIGMAIVWWLARRQGIGLATRHPVMHGWRSLVGVLAMSGWFYAVTKMPLATGMTFNYMSSLWIASFLVASALWTWRPGYAGPRRSLNIALLGAIVLGFVGVLLMLRPNIAQPHGLAGVIGLSSGVLTAMAYMQVSAWRGRASQNRARCFIFAWAVLWVAVPSCWGGACHRGPGWAQACCSCPWASWPQAGNCA